jgi:hypothetical protein
MKILNLLSILTFVVCEPPESETLEKTEEEASSIKAAPSP